MNAAVARRVRQLAQEGAAGRAYGLVVLFRAPPPVHVVAGQLWTDAPVVRVLVAATFMNIIRAHEMLAVRRRAGLVAYSTVASPGTLITAGPLLPADEGIMWARGWRSNAAKALRAVVALR